MATNFMLVLIALLIWTLMAESYQRLGGLHVAGLLKHKSVESATSLALSTADFKNGMTFEVGA